MKNKVSNRIWFTRLAIVFMLLSVSLSLQAEDRYALLIGVDKYSAESELQSLEYAASDVERLRSVLIQRGYASNKVVVLSSTKDNNLIPTRNNILRVLSILGKSSELKAEDSVMIVFSGHGFNMNGDSYLCPADFNSQNPATSSIRVAEIAGTLANLPVGSKFMVLDACRDDLTRGDQTEFNLNSSLKSMRLNDHNSPQGIMFFSSCLPGQISFEDSDLKGGVFMTYFSEGLEGAADFAGNHDKKVSAFELSAYASNRTSDFIRKMKGSSQRPWVDSHTTSDLSICVVPDEVYEEKTQDWGTVTRMSPLEVQAREQASELVYEALLRFAGGRTDETMKSLTNAIEIDDRFFLARQFRALLYMVQGNNMTKTSSYSSTSTIDYGKIAEKYTLAVNDMQSVGGELRIPVPDFLPELELKQGTNVMAKAQKGDFILVRKVISTNGHHWLEVSAIQRGVSDQNKQLKREKFDPKQPVFAFLPHVADYKANEVLIQTATNAGTPFVSNSSSGLQSGFESRPMIDGSRLERGINAYNTAAGIANSFGADLPSIPSISSFIPGGLGGFFR